MIPGVGAEGSPWFHASLPIRPGRRGTGKLLQERSVCGDRRARDPSQDASRSWHCAGARRLPTRRWGQYNSDEVLRLWEFHLMRSNQSVVEELLRVSAHMVGKRMPAYPATNARTILFPSPKLAATPSSGLLQLLQGWRGQEDAGDEACLRARTDCARRHPLVLRYETGKWESRMSNESYVTLVAPQRWKLRLCGAAEAAVGACYIVPDALATLFGTSPAMLELAASLAGLVVLVGACLAVRCRACGLSLVWHGVSTKSVNDWLNWLLDVRTCPRCGHEEQPRQ